jgi:hypothetical protein
VLVPLIKDDLRRGDEASHQAGLPYYKAAGEKMLEAKPQMKHGEFRLWIKRNLGISDRTATNYMDFAKATQGQNGRTLPFSSMNDFHRQTGDRRIGALPAKARFDEAGGRRQTTEDRRFRLRRWF